MASNYTNHYGLCQWEATDQVLRTDFNADNAKVDSTLHGLEENKADKTALEALTETHTADVTALRAENLWVKVGEETSSTAAETQSITIPNAEQYHQLLISYNALTSRGAVKLVWNNSEIGGLMHQNDSSGQLVGRVEFTSIYNGGAVWDHVSYLKSSDSGASSWGSNYSAISQFSGNVTIGLRPVSGTISAGAHFEVYGMKK